MEESYDFPSQMTYFGQVVRSFPHPCPSPCAAPPKGGGGRGDILPSKRSITTDESTEKRIFTTKSTTLKNTLKNIGQAGQAAHDVLIMKVFTFVYFVS